MREKTSTRAQSQLTPSLEGDLANVRNGVFIFLLWTNLAVCALFAGSYVISGEFWLLLFLLPFSIPVALIFYWHKRRISPRVRRVGIIYIFSLFGLMNLTSTPDYLVDFFMMPILFGLSFLTLSTTWAVYSVAYLVFLYVASAIVVYNFQPLPIYYSNDNYRSILISALVSAPITGALFYFYADLWRKANKKLNLTLMSLKQVNEAHGLIIDSVSHDIRNHLMSITGRLELARITDPTSPASAHIEPAFSAAQELNGLLQALEGARQITRRDVTKDNSVSFKDVMAKLDLIFQAQSKEKGLQLNYDSRSELQLIVDPVFFTHNILGNLISNAIKFSPPGAPVTISIKTTSGQTGQPTQATIEVQNYAGWEHAENLQALQGAANNTFKSLPGSQQEKGSGLGLFIVERFCNHMGLEHGISFQEHESGLWVVHSIGAIPVFDGT